MSLLERAQQMKKSTNKEKKSKTETKDIDQKENLETIKKKKEEKDTITTSELEEATTVEKITAKHEPKGLLERLQEKRMPISKKKEYIGLDTKGKKEVIEEKKGFGWNGLGTRRIVFNHNLNDYVYELDEPILNEVEVEVKEELSHLFKMLADVNITNLEKEEKEKYLGEILERIIIDNNIQFIREKKEEKTPKNEKSEKKESQKSKNKIKSLKKIFSFKKKDKLKKPSKKFKLLKKKDSQKSGKKIKLLKKLLIFRKKDREELKEAKEKLLAEIKKSKNKIFYHIFQDFLGYGKINIIMEDEGIEDISCDGHHVPIFIYHKKYGAIPTNVKYKDEKELDSFVVRLTQICGKQISIYSPIVDGKLPDGSRLQTTLARTVTRGSTFTIRKFKENPLTPIDLIDFKSLSLDMAAYFWMTIERGASILFCGGTASGKTTALNALSLFIPSQSKIISIEDTREVNLPHKNWIAGTTRQGFSASDEKTGKDIDMFDLIRAALRQRPKVVIVGEVRGKEAYSLFQAMATGHTSYATVHASDIHTLIQRLENPPISLPRALLTSLDIIVFQNAVDIASKTVRRMTSVTEVVKLDPDTNQLIFMEPFRWISKTDDSFESSGASKVLNNIRLQNDWSEEQLNQELENRKKILTWMLEKNIRDYMDVGRTVSDYEKYPERLIKKAKEEMKK